MRNLLFTLTVLLMTTLTVGAGADPRGGRKTFRDTIGRGMQQTYDLVLNGDETTIVEINGNGRSDLDCFIFDENDNLVVKDDDSSDQCRLAVTPRWTGHFTLIPHSTYRGVAY